MKKEKKFPVDYGEMERYILENTVITADGTMYIITPNGNWMLKQKFIKKYG